MSKRNLSTMPPAVWPAFLFVLMATMTAGCSSVRPPPYPPSAPASQPAPELPEVASAVTVAPAPLEPEQPPAIPMGKVFAKTDFLGVVKQSYVRLTIARTADAEKVYRLFIGDSSQQLNFPWDAQTVNPGYFLIALPAGEYSIQSIAIPVGTTMAVEPMNVVFQVRPEQTTYLGTLQVIGTQEKIRLGGIPIIRPGFEYHVLILDDRVEAEKEFAALSPDQSVTMSIGLMRVSRRGDGSATGIEF